MSEDHPDDAEKSAGEDEERSGEREDPADEGVAPDERAALEGEWDGWIWGESPDIEDDDVTEAFDELLARIAWGEEEGEPGDETPAKPADAEESSGDAVDRALDALEADRDDVTEKSSRSVRFEDLLERVKQREDRAERIGQPVTDEHDFESIPDAKGAGSILLVGPTGTAPDDETCLSAFDLVDIDEQRVLLVTLERRGPSRLELFRDRYALDEPAAIAHIHRGGTEPSVGEDEIRTAHVSDPADLTQLGINISMIVSDWADADGELTICLHSLTTLIRAVDDQRVFRFLHLLLGRLEDAEARVHVHVDADAHQPQVIGLYRELFDTTVEVTDAGLQVVG